MRRSILACGGICTLGAGVVGTYYAQPFFETHVNPDRVDVEIHLRETLSKKESRVETLNEELSEQKELNEEKGKDISYLSGDISLLDTEISETDKIYRDKDSQLEKRNQTIRQQDEKNQAQERTSKSLKEKILDSESELDKEKNNSKRLEGILAKELERLSLTREQILTDKTIDLRLLKVEMDQITKKSTKGDTTTFEIVERGNKKTTFYVNKKNFTNHESIAQKLKTEGIKFGLVDAFKTWEKEIVLKIYDVDFSWKTNKPEEKRKYAKNESTHTFKLSDYFQKQHLEDAFKVFIAIQEIENFPLCFDQSTRVSNSFVFCENMDIKQEFFTTNHLQWPVFSKKGKEAQIVTWSNRFRSFNDFVKYWAIKTVNFIKTRKLNLLDLLNPVLMSKNYRNS